MHHVSNWKKERERERERPDKTAAGKEEHACPTPEGGVQWADRESQVRQGKREKV